MAKKFIEGNFLQVAFDRALNNAKVRCPHSPDYNPDFKGVEYAPFARPTSNGCVLFFVALILFAVSLFVVVMAMVVTTKVIVRRRHCKWVASLPRSQLQMLWKDQHSKDDKDAFLNEATVSMFKKRCDSFVVTYVYARHHYWEHWVISQRTSQPWSNSNYLGVAWQADH